MLIFFPANMNNFMFHIEHVEKSKFMLCSLLTVCLCPGVGGDEAAEDGQVQLQVHHAQEWHQSKLL